jgi:hypothetical protein
VAEDESTVIIAIKGTSAPWIVGGEGPTKKKDKHNNNMLFSCCCARAGPMWSTVCPCYAGSGKCDIGCVQQAMMEDRDLFYHLGTVCSLPMSSSHIHLTVGAIRSCTITYRTCTQMRTSGSQDTHSVVLSHHCLESPLAFLPSRSSHQVTRWLRRGFIFLYR